MSVESQIIAIMSWLPSNCSDEAFDAALEACKRLKLRQIARNVFNHLIDSEERVARLSYAGRVAK